MASGQTFAFPGRDSGECYPPTNDFDVRGWTEAHTLAPGREEASFPAGMIAVGVVVGIIAERGWLVIAAMVAWALLWHVATYRRNDVVTIDPVRRQISWRRENDTSRDVRCLFAFDDVVKAKRMLSAVVCMPTGGLFYELVQLDVGTRRLKARVPRGTAPQFVESMNSLRLSS